ncbi:thioesterase-like superfamily-domain-containing protein [Coprinopsis sp. MPI-PUGE-AT-0042]|nr:thioesterase-like superfamily-domain-containing protein [Coprinopsis sp. MPI-PUGE-AT-0042]
MAPYNEAVKVTRVSTIGTGQCSNAEGTVVKYEGQMDPAWNIGAVPCGGYVLALVLEACIQHQAKTSHVDPLHISAYFLRPSSSKVPFAVKVTSLKVGKGFTNLKADLVQEGALKVTAQAIFGSNRAPLDGGFTLQPPSPYARRIPLHSHPSEVTHSPMFGEWANHEYTSWALDKQTVAKNQPSYAPNRTNAESIGGPGLEWASWYEFQKETEALGDVYIPLLVDMFNGSVKLLPSEEGELGNTWEPTMTLSIDFKFPISELGLEHSKRAVGLYSAGKFVNHPQSRHEVYVEVWTAPSEIGKGRVEEGWRDQQRCLAIATQMAISVPMEINLRNAARAENGKLFPFASLTPVILI